MFKSTDSGANWSASNNGLTDTFLLALAIDPITPGILYAGSSGFMGGVVFKSTDSGASWSAFDNGLATTSVLALAIDPITPSTLYAGTDGGGVFDRTEGSTSTGGRRRPVRRPHQERKRMEKIGVRPAE